MSHQEAEGGNPGEYGEEAQEAICAGLHYEELAGFYERWVEYVVRTK